MSEGTLGEMVAEIRDHAGSQGVRFGTILDRAIDKLERLQRENAELRQRVEAMRGYLLHIKVLASTILTSEEQLEEKR